MGGQLVRLASVLMGAVPFDEGNVNDTYRGQVLTDDGVTKSAVIKDLDDKQLANELFVSVIAKALDLPTPEIFLAEARTDVLRLRKGRETSGGRICLASVDVKVPNLTFRLGVANDAAKERIYSDLQRWSGLGAVIAFDTWIANVDRHGGNILVGGAGEYWLIDHGHSLTGPDWTPTTLDPNQVYLNKVATWANPRLSDPDRAAKATDIDKSSGQMHSLNVGSCRTTARVDEILVPGDCDAAEQFVRQRKSLVAKQAKGLIGVSVLA